MFNVQEQGTELIILQNNITEEILLNTDDGGHYDCVFFDMHASAVFHV